MPAKKLMPLSNPQNIIYTIGHSTRSIEEFITMLESFHVKYLADIRRFPASRKFPHFNKTNLAGSLHEKGISYTHIKTLGGRRPVQKDSHNTRWRNSSFRGYADYMETKEFSNGINELADVASIGITAYMCSESVWWRCHRSMVSDYLKAKGWKVFHIMAISRVEEHPYSSPAVVSGEKVYYSDGNLFNL